MRKFLTCSILVAGLLAGSVASAQATVNPAHSCRFQRREAGRWTVNEVRWTVKCLAKRMHVSADKARYIAYRESRYHRWAVSWTGCCKGVFQHNMNYWWERVHSHARKLNKYAVHNRNWYSPRANIVVTFAMVKSAGWGPWGG